MKQNPHTVNLKTETDNSSNIYYNLINWKTTKSNICKNFINNQKATFDIIYTLQNLQLDNTINNNAYDLRNKYKIEYS